MYRRKQNAPDYLNYLLLEVDWILLAEYLKIHYEKIA